MAIHEIQDKDQPYFPYMHVAVFFIFLKCVVEQILNARQFYRLKQSAKKMPKEIRMLGIDPERYKLAIEYERSKLAFEMLVLSIKTGYEFIFTLTYAMPLIWNKISFPIPFTSSEEFQRGFAFLCIETLRMKVIDIPILLYETFVIEEKFGLSKKNLSSFFSDACVESLITLFVSPVILYGYLQLIEHAPDNFFYLAAFLIGVTLLIQTLYQNYIQPLFSNFQELQEGQLKVDINELAEGLNFPLKHVMRTKGFRRQDHSNAFLIGMWRDKRIVIQELLMEQLGIQEVVAVVSHELGHWKHNHFNITMLIFYTRVTLFFLLSSFFRSNDAIFLSFGFTDKSTFVGTALFYNLFSPMNSVFEFLTLLITRCFEFQADTFACNQGYGYYLMSGLVKVQVENVNALNPDPWYAWAKFSHPGLFERIHKIKHRLYQIESQNGLSNAEIEEKIKTFMEKHVFVQSIKTTNLKDKSTPKNAERRQYSHVNNEIPAVQMSSASLTNSNHINNAFNPNQRGLNMISQGDQQLLMNEQYQRNCQVIQSQHNFLHNLTNQQLLNQTLKQPIFLPSQPQPMPFPQLQNHHIQNIQNAIPSYISQHLGNNQQMLMQTTQQQQQQQHQQQVLNQHSFQQQQQLQQQQQQIMQFAQAQQQQQQQQQLQNQQIHQHHTQMTQSSPNLQNLQNLEMHAADHIRQQGYSFPAMGMHNNYSLPNLNEQHRQNLIVKEENHDNKLNGIVRNKQFRHSLSDVSDSGEISSSCFDGPEAKRMQFREDALLRDGAAFQNNNNNNSFSSSERARLGQSPQMIQSESEGSSSSVMRNDSIYSRDVFQNYNNQQQSRFMHNNTVMGIPFVSNSAVSNRFFPNYWGRF